MNKLQKLVIAILFVSSLIYVFFDINDIDVNKKSRPDLAVSSAMGGAIKYADDAASIIKNADIERASVLVLYKSTSPLQTNSSMETGISYISFFTFNAEMQYKLMPLPVDVFTRMPDIKFVQQFDYVLLPYDMTLKNVCKLIKQASDKWLLYKCEKRSIGKSPELTTVMQVVKIYLLVAMKHTGSFTLNKGARLIDVFSKIKFRLTNSDLSRVLILRHNKIIHVNLIRYIQTKDIVYNPLLRDKDTVYIPQAGEHFDINKIKKTMKSLIIKENE
ncbi:MAG: hypothetical protein M1381_02500 [Deltaproteobacteria bacterium]|nr:hypothetical protein [Deltaproteobacteria bacterium]